MSHRVAVFEAFFAFLIFAAGISAYDTPVSPRAAIGTTVAAFTGGDAGEGLDLDGVFPYAVNVRGPGGLQVRDALFTLDTAPGVTVTAANEILSWHFPDYGTTANDNNLETVMQSIRWTAIGQGGLVSVNLANLTIGKVYKLQLLFAESCCNRGFDVLVEGALIVNEFNIPAVQGGINNLARGAVITHLFTAADTTLNIVLNGNTSTQPDTNPILNALTLEDLGSVSIRAKVVRTAPNSDSLKCKYTITLPAGFVPLGASVNATVGGVGAVFVLDANGKGTNALGTCKLKQLPGSNQWTLRIKQSRGSFAASWLDEGMVDVTIWNAPVTFYSSLFIDGNGSTIFSNHLYTANLGRLGLTRP